MASPAMPAVEAAAAAAVPDWVGGCDLAVCQVLQDMSAQIVANCATFGSALQGVCGKAQDALPASDCSAMSDCSDACQTFLAAFNTLSNAVLQLASDVESTVTKPLHRVIVSLTEESVGRMKHWRQVRGRFAELQERYRRSRQRSIEARGKLASSDSAERARWFRRPNIEGQAASEQHAAMCDLAKCEEELRESEASLRRLEDESRERLRQLDREKQTLLRGALTKGAGSLRQLVLVAYKAPEPDSGPSSTASKESRETFQGVMPLAAGIGCEDDECAVRAGSVGGEEERPACPNPADGFRTEEEGSQTSEPQGVVPGPRWQPEAASPEAAAESAAPLDPSAKYVQQVFDGGMELDIHELSNSDEEDLASFRAETWTPMTQSKPVAASSKKRSLVFQSSGSSLIAEASVRGKPSSAVQLQRHSMPGLCVPQGRGPQEGKGTANEDPSVAARDLERTLDLCRRSAQLACLQQASSSAPATRCGAVPAPAGKVSPSATPTACLAPARPAEPAEICAEEKAGTHEPLVKPAMTCDAKAAAATSSPDSDDEDHGSGARTAEAPLPLDGPELDLEILPLVTESPQRWFERYVRRLSGRLAGASVISWEKLQERANEQPLGGHVGKLETFWIRRLDAARGEAATTTPESAEGLVCFQFVQGFSANFVRILHLSVTSAEGGLDMWRSTLPSAIFEVRRLIFATLPVDNLRAVVLAGEDDAGRIYVDNDVEAAYHKCRFRWFQLTQNLRRTKSTVVRRGRLRPSSRFLVLHAQRGPTDPLAPRGSKFNPMPALLLKSDPTLTPSDAPPLDKPANDSQHPVAGFSTW